MFIRVPPARAKISPDPKEKATTMTIKQPASKAAVPSAAATAAARTPRRRLILLASLTFTYTGTRTFAAANGDKVFSAITGTGTFTRTTAHSTETDTITGGTGRFAGASGTYTDTISTVVVSATSTSKISRATAAAQGQIRY